jgi:hypothetical protein
MSILYADVVADANEKLRNREKSLLDEQTMLSILNDVVALAHRIASSVDPALTRKSTPINLLPATGIGPYPLPGDFNAPVDPGGMFNENGLPVEKSSRQENMKAASSPGPPDLYWLEGFNPTNCYFNRVTDAARTYTLYYFPSVARIALDNGAVPVDSVIPLPDYFFELIVQFLVKWAAQVDEYSTIEEDEKITMMYGRVVRLLTARAPKLTLTMSGVGF